MCCQGNFRGAVAFLLSSLLGIASAAVFNHIYNGKIQSEITEPVLENLKTEDIKPSAQNTYSTTKVKIISKPQPADCGSSPEFLKLKRGKATVLVTFLANGEIGDVVAFLSSSESATENALREAKNIKFEPAKRDGVPYATVEVVQYNY